MSDAPLAWQYRPTPASYYINSVATSARGERMVAGTYYYDYGQARRPSLPVEAAPFGTYCLDGQGRLLWKDEFAASEGVYWCAITPAADYVCGCGAYTQSQGFVAIYDGGSGQRLVFYTGTPGRVSICVFAPSAQLLATGGSELLFFRRAAGGFDSTPLHLALPTIDPTRADAVQGLAVDVTGSLIAVGTVQGNILLVDIANGTPTIVAQYRCGASVHSIAMDWVGKCFIAGTSPVKGESQGKVYYFDVAAFRSGGQPAWSQSLPGAGPIYGVAMNEAGTIASAVGNVGSSGVAGLLDLGPGSGTWRWTAATAHNPNSTSMSGDGGLFTVADGHPDNTPGAFYLFGDDSAAPRWSYPTDNMSWPMEISSSGNAAVAGSDNGWVYGFAPLRVFAQDGD